MFKYTRHTKSSYYYCYDGIFDENNAIELAQ